jgi:spore germination cell wall hydrolase CwlJ-like protein
MVTSLRSALLICAALSASSVAPAQVGPSAQPVALASAVSPSAIAQELLRKSDQLAVPPEEQAAPSDSDSGIAPGADANATLPALVERYASADPGDRDLECLAAGVYFESKGEPLAGQLAVGQVIANRVDSGRFADSYCGVLFQRGQFSFVRGHSWPRISKDSSAWRTAVAIAKIVDGDLKDSLAENALYFHARRVHPGWRMKRVASIGNHVFYR